MTAAREAVHRIFYRESAHRSFSSLAAREPAVALLRGPGRAHGGLLPGVHRELAGPGLPQAALRGPRPEAQVTTALC